MGFNSQAGHLLVRTQAAPNTFPADFAAAHRGVRLRSGSLGANRELMVADPEIGGGRDRTQAYLGPVSFSGDFDMYARMEAITTFLKAGFGSAQSTVADGVGTHTITPSDSATLPYLAFQEKIGDGMETSQYTDGVVNTIHFEAEAAGYLLATIGIIAKRSQVGATPIPPEDIEWDESPLTVGTNITCRFGGLTLPAKSFAFDLNNNFEDDDFYLGSLFLGDLTAKGREVSGSFTVRPNDSAMWRQAVLGNAAATAPTGEVTLNDFVIKAETYENIDGATTPTKSSLELTIPNIALEPFGLEPSGDDIIENDISFQALRPSSATPICTVVVKSAAEAIA